jgi:hypothetical protein
MLRLWNAIATRAWVLRVWFLVGLLLFFLLGFHTVEHFGWFAPEATVEHHH